MTSPHINELRTQLLATLADLRNRENPMEPDRARAVAQVASVLVDSAKVEVDYLKATGQDNAPFLETPPDPLQLPNGSQGAGPFPPGITGVTQHRLRG